MTFNQGVDLALHQGPARVWMFTGVLVLTLAWAVPGAADPVTDAHFAKTFRLFCARMMNNLEPLREFASKQKLRSKRWPQQLKTRFVRTRNFQRWALTHEGHPYLLAIDRLPHPKSRSGYINVCMLQSEKADINGVVSQIKSSFPGQLYNFESPTPLGPDERGFIVKNYPEVDLLTLSLRHTSDGRLSLSALKIFE